ncbi:hypothetical protein FRC12_024592, partial [Ceratobasidium sp. 428]
MSHFDSPPSSRDSSPAPIRDTQPRIPDSPDTTSRGTQRHHALYDTPVEGTQPTDLERSHRNRAMSQRGRDTAEYKERCKPKSKSNATPNNQPSAPGPTPKRSAKRVTMRFDGESDDDDDDERPAKSRKTEHARSEAASPPPKPPGRGPTMAGGSSANGRPGAATDRAADGQLEPADGRRGLPDGRRGYADGSRGSTDGNRGHSGDGGRRIDSQRGPASERGVILDSAPARGARGARGPSTRTTTATSPEEEAQSLSDIDSPQVAPTQRYPQIRCEATTKIPSLNKTGGVPLPIDLTTGDSQPTESRKRRASEQEAGPKKHRRIESRGSSVEEELDPRANEPQDPPPTPPALPSFLLPPPHSTSSTQCAVADAFRSQRQSEPARSRAYDSIGYRRSPIPEPRQWPARFAVNPSNSGRPTSSQRPVLTSRDVQQPSPAPRAPLAPVATSTPRRMEPTPGSQRAAPHRTHHPSQHDPNTATKSDTESDIESEPESRKSKKSEKRHRQRSKGKGKARAKDRSPEPTTRPREDDQPRPRGPDPSRDTLENRRADAQLVVARLQALLQEPNPDQAEYESLTRIASSLIGADSWLSSAGAGPSSSRAGPSASHAGPSASHAGPSVSHAGPSYATNRDARPSSRGAGYSGRDSDNGDHGCNDTSSDDEPEDDDDDPELPNRSGLARYPGTRGKVASRAIPMLQLMVTLKGVYQDTDTLIKWGRTCYDRAYRAHFRHRRYRRCPDDLLHTIIGRVSNLRTEVKRRIREVVQYLYKFISTTDEWDMERNRRRATQLGHNTFHCLDLQHSRRQYENPAFRRAILAAFFWFEDTYMIRDTATIERLYDEGLPLPAVAFVLTMMQECIEGWETGRFRSRDLNINTQRGIFDAHLQGLINYRSRAATRLGGFQVFWFREGLSWANVRVHQYDDEDDMYCQSITRADDVVPDGASDSEDDRDPAPEPESDPEPQADPEP